MGRTVKRFHSGVMRLEEHIITPEYVEARPMPNGHGYNSRVAERSYERSQRGTRYIGRQHT